MTLPKKIKEQEFRRNEMLAAAAKLLNDRPLDEVLMTDIAKESGYTIRTVYKYFSGKGELFYYLLTVLLEKRAQWLTKEYQYGKNGLEKILIYALGYYEFSKRHPLELYLTMQQRYGFKPLEAVRSELDDELGNRWLKIININRSIFQNGIDEGYFIPEITCERMQDYLIKTLRVIVSEVIILKTQPEDYFFGFIKIFFKSIVTGKGQIILDQMLEKRPEFQHLPDEIRLN